MTPEALLPYFLAAHLVGDFVLQNNWMSSRKAASHEVCSCHVGAYLLPFLGLVLFAGAPLWAVLLIGAQHYAQDRWALHLRWMKWYGQTPPDKWPVGPLCVDQSFHIAWMAVVCLIAQHIN